MRWGTSTYPKNYKPPRNNKNFKVQNKNLPDNPITLRPKNMIPIKMALSPKHRFQSPDGALTSSKVELKLALYTVISNAVK